MTPLRRPSPDRARNHSGITRLGRDPHGALPHRHRGSGARRQQRRARHGVKLPELSAVGARQPHGRAGRGRSRTRTTRVELRGDLRPTPHRRASRGSRTRPPRPHPSNGDVESRIPVEIDSSHDLPRFGIDAYEPVKAPAQSRPSANATRTVGTTGSSGPRARRAASRRPGGVDSHDHAEAAGATQTLPAPVASPIAGAPSRSSSRRAGWPDRGA